MRRMLACVAMILLPTSVLAAGWTAQMEDDEGGQLLVASVVGDAEGGVTPRLSLMCGGSEGMMLRYEMAGDGETPGSEDDFLFENESQQARVHMIYEDMDGAYAAYFPPSDPLIGLLENGADLFISPSGENAAAQNFSLRGSTRAISQVLKRC